MKITGTLVRLGIVATVLLLFTALIVVVFGQMRFDRTNTYTAEFQNISGLRNGQFVRASGVEIGKVKAIKLVDGGQATTEWRRGAHVEIDEQQLTGLAVSRDGRTLDPEELEQLFRAERPA